MMTIVVSLGDFVNEMQILSDESHAYLNKITGELITLGNEYIDIVESSDDFDEYNDWQKDIILETERVLSSDDYLEIPTKFDIHDYEIMERFCLSFPNEKISDGLLYTIRGSGAFRRFKDAIYRYEIEADWFKFRDEAYKEIAISWLESEGFVYNDDME